MEAPLHSSPHGSEYNLQVLFFVYLCTYICHNSFLTSIGFSYMYYLATWFFKINSVSWSFSHISTYRPIIYVYFNIFNHSPFMTLRAFRFFFMITNKEAMGILVPIYLTTHVKTSIGWIPRSQIALSK